MRDPGPLLASGRDSDIFEYGPEHVLKRSRDGRSLADEARTMEHVHALGYPVPAPVELSEDGTDLVIERIPGPLMMDELSRRPWSVRQQGRVLARLHQRLHDMPAPAWLAPAPGRPGDRLLHLDLHPLNVIMSDRGPVVIDWANAARGAPETDVALTWLLVAAGGMPLGRAKAAVLGLGRSLLVGSFLASFDRRSVVEHLPGVVAWKQRDPHMSDVEQAAMQRVLAGAVRSVETR